MALAGDDPLGTLAGDGHGSAVVGNMGYSTARCTVVAQEECMTRREDVPVTGGSVHGGHDPLGTLAEDGHRLAVGDNIGYGTARLTAGGREECMTRRVDVLATGGRVYDGPDPAWPVGYLCGGRALVGHRAQH